MTPGFLYALVALLFGFGMGLDVLVTRIGLSRGMVEANPFFKIFPQKFRDFIFKTAFGSFLDGGLKVIGAGVIAAIFYNLGFGHENGSYYDSLIEGIPMIGVYGLVIRNLLIMPKKGK